jgi:hypothetical protein
MSGVFYVGAISSPGTEGPQTPPPPRTIVRAPATVNGSGRRMSYEEGVAQQILQMNQTVAGTNHLGDFSEEMPPPPENDRNGRGTGDEGRSRLPYTYMGIQGVAPAQILLPAIGAAQVVVSFTCPRRQNGEIEFVANQFVGGGWTEGTGAIIWQILIDGIPVQGYDAILGSLGTTASPGWLGKGAIQFSENQLVQLRVTNVSIAVAGQILLGLLRGHFEPVETKTPNAW